MKRFIAMLLCTALVVGLCALTATESKNDPQYTPQPAPYTPDGYGQVYSAVLNAKRNSDMLLRNGAINESSDIADGATAGDYIGTNVQISGIDEGDRVKTDGEYIYVIDDNKLCIFKAEDGNAEKLCCVDLAPMESEGFYAQEMYVCDGRLIVIGSIYTYNSDEIINKTKLMIFDTASKTEPTLLSTSTQDGYLLSSRLYDGKLYIVSNYELYGEPDENEPRSYVPSVECDGKETAVPCDCICIMPGEPEASYTVACAYDAQSGSDLGTMSILGGGDIVMMSYNYLYVAVARISEEELDSHVEYGRTVQNMRRIDETDICRISLETMSVDGSCTVNGLLDGQFAMDEYDGMLRVVSCASNDTYFIEDDGENSYFGYTWDPDDENSENALYVFDKDLKLLSSVEGLAKGEYVRSVRFDGEYAYFCTFREIDPLFAVCLTDPQNPEIVSEYKISGFSEYLHPWNGDKLFGFGYETEENEYGAVFQSGLKLVMFDVSDKRNVTALQSVFIPDAYSEAIYDHNAMLISAEKNIIGFATEDEYLIYSYSDADGFTLCTSLELGGFSYGARAVYINGWIYLINGTDISAETI